MVIDLLLAQLVDPFRIGLLVALAFTTFRTLAHTGRIIPLALGLAFVAVLIASSTGADSPGGYPVAIGVGILANGLILAAIFAVILLWRRVMGRTDRPR